jgi:sentrin-specific protease 8
LVDSKTIVQQLMIDMRQPNWLTLDFKQTFYDEAVLAYEDIATLFPGNWLTDSIITFYYLYLREKYADDKFCFVNPSLTFWVGMDPNAAKEAIGRFELEKKEFIFLPITDCTNINSAGGTHWSLAVYDRNNDVFRYYDSLSNYNISSARRICAAIAPFVRMKDKRFNFQSRPTPTQKNGSDCGCYLLAITEYLAQNNGDDTDIEHSITPNFASELRLKILELIDNMRKKEE